METMKTTQSFKILFLSNKRHRTRAKSLKIEEAPNRNFPKEKGTGKFKFSDSIF